MPDKLPGRDEDRGWDDSPLTVFERVTRRRSDINLPSSGKVDPRIKAKTPNVLEGLRKAGEGYGKLQELMKRKN